MKIAITIATMTLLAVGLTRTASAQADGQDAYRKECKSCHGVNGVPPARAKGQYKKIKAVGEDGFITSLSVDSIMKILGNGLDKDMKSFKSKLTEPEMRGVATYILTLAKKEGS